jgi:hypothetical protein
MGSFLSFLHAFKSVSFPRWEVSFSPGIFLLSSSFHEKKEEQGDKGKRDEDVQE